MVMSQLFVRLTQHDDVMWENEVFTPHEFFVELCMVTGMGQTFDQVLVLHFVLRLELVVAWETSVARFKE
jgi:hypothetical protein